MKKGQPFESLQNAKFRTRESHELERVTGGMAADLSLDTLTIWSSGPATNDGQDPGDSTEI